MGRRRKEGVVYSTTQSSGATMRLQTRLRQLPDDLSRDTQVVFETGFGETRGVDYPTAFTLECFSIITPPST